MKSTLLRSHVHGHHYTRIYLRSHEDFAELHAAPAENDYVFAYSRVDFGELDGFVREQKSAQVIDLRFSTETVFARLGRRSRQEIRKTYSDDDLTVTVDDTDRDSSYHFYAMIKESEGALPDIEEDFDSVRWINAYLGDRLISVNSVYSNDHILRGKHLASLRKQPGIDTAVVGRINRRLLWEACALGIAEGIEEFDMGGVDLTDPTKRGIADFKRHFGGETREIFVYRYSSRTWPDAIQRASDVGRSIF